jgi:DNA modification methylase
MNLIQGDCLEKMKDLSDNSIDIVIADLPYGRFKHLDWDKTIDLKVMWREIWRISKDNAPVFLFGDMKFGAELINSCPRHFKYEIVWDKKITTTPLLSRKRLGKATEYIFIFYKKQPVYNYAKYHKKLYKQVQDVRVKKGVKSKMNKNKVCGHVGYKGKGGKQFEPKLPTNIIEQPKSMVLGKGKNFKYHSKGKMYDPTLPTNIISVNAVRCKKIIPNITEKPQFILEFVLKYFSNEGDTCLDLTMGSGSCGEACKTLGRNFVGIELNKEHYDIACKRLL